MFENLGWWEIVFLIMIAILVFGPERLPQFVGDAARFMKRIREYLGRATNEFQEQLGPDVELADLHPKRFVQKHLLSQEDMDSFREPFRKLEQDIDMQALMSKDWDPTSTKDLPAPVPRFDADAT